MGQKSTGKASPVVAVVGATGHTARFVVEELLRRKTKAIAIARNLEALARVSFSGEVGSSTSQFGRRRVARFGTH